MEDGTHTIDEALQLRCCGPVRPDQPATCIGPQCMAWRWALEPNPNFIPSSIAGIGSDGSNRGGDRYRRGTTHGYCGLAGSAGP